MQTRHIVAHERSWNRDGKANYGIPEHKLWGILQAYEQICKRWRLRRRGGEDYFK